jgi:hypothetical protein
MTTADPAQNGVGKRKFGLSIPQVLCILAAVLSLSSCSAGSSSSASGKQDCGSLTSALDEARLASKLARDLSRHSDSEGGMTVTDAEAREIRAHENDQGAARDQAAAGGCI